MSKYVILLLAFVLTNAAVQAQLLPLSQSKDTVPPYQQEPVYIMPTFTPNGDGYNDVWKPIYHTIIDSVKVLVVDKLGDTSFYSTKVDFSWNGSNAEGRWYMNAFYTYTFRFKVNNEWYEKRGTVKLLR